MQISCFTPALDHMCSIVRASGVLSELHKSVNENIQVKYFTDNFDIRDIKGSSIVFMLRPDTLEQIQTLEACKEYKIPIVIDYDDNFFEIQEHNPFHKDRLKRKIDYKENVKKCLELADAVIVSTESIKQAYEPYNSNITVIQNCFDDYCFDYAKEVSNKKLVLWRGGDSHGKDLELYKEQIKKLIINHRDYTFMFWSNVDKHPVWLVELSKVVKNIVFEKPVNSMYYYLWLKDFNPFLTLVPLEFSKFNEGKSDLAKIEAIASGGLCLAPRMQEWDWNGENNLIYETVEGFGNKADLLINEHREHGLNDMWNRNLEYLKTYKLLSRNNVMRYYVFSKLLRSKQ